MATATEAGGGGAWRMKRLIIPGLTTKWKYPRPPPRVASKINTAMKMILRFNVHRPWLKMRLRNPAGPGSSNTQTSYCSKSEFGRPRRATQRIRIVANTLELPLRNLAAPITFSRGLAGISPPPPKHYGLRPSYYLCNGPIRNDSPAVNHNTSGRNYGKRNRIFFN